MCIVIDADVFSYVINPNSSNHGDFRPVKDWIVSGKGKLVYGGTKYAEEILGHQGFRGFLVQMEHKGKTVNVACGSVDKVEVDLKQNIKGSGFNDYHIVAIILVSGCKLVCSNDQGLSNLISVCYNRVARPLMKRVSKRVSIRWPIHRPIIYKKQTHRVHLCDQNIAACCQ